MVVASDTCGETSDKGCGWDTQRDTDLWKTPEQVKSVVYDYPIVVNKFYNLIEEESNHSKFKKLAQKDSATEECSDLLTRMELEVSEDEEEVVVEEEEEEVLSLEESGILPKNIEEIEDKFNGKGEAKKNQKRKMGWGPIIRAPRPRRGPEDGRSMMEKAQDLKKVKNLEKGVPWTGMKRVLMLVVKMTRRWVTMLKPEVEKRVEELASHLEKEALLPPRIEWNAQEGSSSELGQLAAPLLVPSAVSSKCRNDQVASIDIRVSSVLS